MRECFCFGREAVSASGKAVRGLVKSLIIIFIEETFSQTWFSKRTSEIKIKTNLCKRTKNMKFIKHLKCQ